MVSANKIEILRIAETVAQEKMIETEIVLSALEEAIVKAVTPKSVPPKPVSNPRDNYKKSNKSVVKRLFDIIKNSHFILICFQEKFEEIENLKYFENMKKKLSHNFKVKIINNEFYKGNIFNYQKHFFLIGKRI